MSEGRTKSGAVCLGRTGKALDVTPPDSGGAGKGAGRSIGSSWRASRLFAA